MKKRNILALILAALMLLNVLAACGNGEQPSSSPSGSGVVTDGDNETDGGDGGNSGDGETDNETDIMVPILPTRPDEPGGEIIYGSVTRMTNIFSLGFPGGNNAVNYDISRLTNGLSTYEWTPDEVFILNPIVVKKETVRNNSDGSKTYIFEIHDDLFFSDGSSITAQNYVFTSLLGNSPEYGAIGAQNTPNMEYVGWAEYNSGETRNFAGVRLLGEYEFSVTIAAEELPFYYETYLAAVGPSPMHIVAPGVSVIDSPQGASLSEEYTEDLIRYTITDDDIGQLYYPTVFSGPYMLTSYDPADASAVLDYNPYFKGCYDGTKPLVARIIIVETPQATRIDMLATGAVELLPGVGGSAVNAGLDVADKADSGISYLNYPRAGYGKIHFRHDVGPTRFQSVRQAVTYCLDRIEFARQFTQGYGIVVHGYYGASMREYRENRDELDVRLNQYPFSVENAIAVLVDDGWIYNSEGGDYEEGSGLPRYKRVDGELEALVIKWFSTEGNVVSDLISTMLVPEAIKAGIVIEKTEGDFPTLQSNMQSPDGEYHMFNLATGFSIVSYVWFYYGTNEAFMGIYNANFIRNEELERLTLEMKATDPSDYDSWSSKWVELQVLWNELVVDIPLYSDIYFDFYPANLQNYHTTPMWSWSYAIPYSYFG